MRLSADLHLLILVTSVLANERPGKEHEACFALLYSLGDGSEPGKPCYISGRHAENARFGRLGG